MKALVKRKAEPGLWLEDVPEPEVGLNDVLIRVDRTGICGTDVHIYKWDDWARRTIPVPMVVGHEFVGEVVRVGANVADFHPGEVVSGEGHVVCGRCRNCLAGRRHLCKDTSGVGVNRPGAFAEYISLPMTNVWHHDPKIDRDVAAIFDPFGNAVHTALSFDVLGEDVLITGAGPIGIMAAAVVRHAGARHVVITDVNPYRLDLAKKLGASVALDIRGGTLADVQERLGMKEGFDVGLEMSGNPAAFRDMLAHMCHGGKIAMLGIPEKEIAIDWRTVVFNMLTIKGIYGREMYETWYKMTVMIQSGLDISPVITHRFPYGEFQKGFDQMLSGQSGKVILSWRGEEMRPPALRFGDLAAHDVLGAFAMPFARQRFASLGNRGGFSGARIWRIETESGPYCLRAWPENGPTPEQLGRIHGLMIAARHAGLDFVPEVFSAPEHRTYVEWSGRLWDLTLWMPGQADFHFRPFVARLEAACTALACLHSAWAACSQGSGPCPAIRRRIDRAATWRTLVDAGWRPSFSSAGTSPTDHQARRAWQLLRDRMAEIPGRLAYWSCLALPLQPCLCDVWHDHILFEEDRVTGIVDYGSVKQDNAAVDLARLLGSLVPDDSKMWAAGLSAYTRLRPLTSEEQGLIAALDQTGTLAAAANWLIWIYHDGRRFEDARAVAARMEGLLSRLAKW